MSNDVSYGSITTPLLDPPPPSLTRSNTTKTLLFVGLLVTTAISFLFVLSEHLSLTKSLPIQILILLQTVTICITSLLCLPQSFTEIMSGLLLYPRLELLPIVLMTCLSKTVASILCFHVGRNWFTNTNTDNEFVQNLSKTINEQPVLSIFLVTLSCLPAFAKSYGLGSALASSSHSMSKIYTIFGVCTFLTGIPASYAFVSVGAGANDRANDGDYSGPHRSKWVGLVGICGSVLLGGFLVGNLSTRKLERMQMQEN